jgi:UDP-N-acetylglucosamine--N-acetylmuramyl-(pentapeptide) pyrophosphoryl-undecaprenol N-acetylglucosamine transferase
VKPYKLIVSGGGTGGHIYPALAIAEAFKAQFASPDILFVGAKGKMEMEKVPKAGFEIEGIWISGFQRSLSFQNILFPLKVLVSLIQSFFIIKKFKPTVVVGTGGFASGPLLQMAQWLNVPTLIQEQNSYPGITNRILSKKVDKICVAYEEMERYFPQSKIRLTGNPIRPLMLDHTITPADAKSFFGLNPEKKTLVIIGGSLGARRINELVAAQVEFFKRHSLQVIWQCGALYFEKYKKFAQEDVVVRPFVYEMEQLYTASDVIISRAGAGSISELSCVGKPLLLIPSPNVTANHQFHNAQALVKKGAALLLEERELDSKFQEVFSTLITNNTLNKEMQRELRALAKPNAAQDIVNEIMHLV